MAVGVDSRPRQRLEFVLVGLHHDEFQPLCVGFGISTPADAARAAKHANGVIVGSAILRIIERGGKPSDVEKFVAKLRRAID